MKYLDSKKLFILSIFSLTILPQSQAMFRSLNISATGMAAQEANVANISNNIANVNTIGFKKSRTETEDLSYQTQIEAGARSSATTRYNSGLQFGSGTRVTANKKDFSGGQPQITNNPYDLSIGGDGFFGIMLPSGQLVYTRDGAFTVDSSGTIVTKQGYKLFPGLNVPPTTLSVHIAPDGKVDAYLANQTEPQNVGTIPVFTFVNPAGLKSSGQNMYTNTMSSGTPNQMVAGNENAGKIEQGVLETSNVQIMTEMTDLIKAQRAYEMNSKVMGVSDQMMQATNNIR